MSQGTQGAEHLTEFQSAARDVLIGRAKRGPGHTLTYEELLAELNSRMLPQNLAQTLGTISHYERRHGRPLLSAIVLGMHTDKPGAGFWVMVEDEMKLPVEDRDRFLAGKLAEIFAYWSA